MAITTPDAVPGEIIEAAWGDAVRSDLNMLDSTKFNAAGGNVTGSVAVTAGNLTVAAGAIEATTGSITAPAGFVRAGGDPTNSVVGAQLHGANGRIHSMCNNLGATSNVGLNRGGSGGSADAGAQFIAFSRVGTIIGSVTIAANLTSVAYNMTSDPRLKYRDGDPVDAVETVRQLGHAAFLGRWLHPDTGEPFGEPRVLLASTDVEDIAPWAVTGERDAVDEHGQPIYQQVDFIGLVPTLFAALTDALDRIAALEAAA